MINFIGLLGILGGAFVSLWAVLKYILLGSYGLDTESSKRLVERCVTESQWIWVLRSEHVERPKFPRIFEAFVLLGGTFIHVSRAERLMTAGWKGKEDVCTVSFFRWRRSKVDLLIRSGARSGIVPVAAMTPGDADRLGELEADPEAEVFLNKGSYEDIEAAVVDVVLGKSKKTGMILHGRPGTGKTQFVKYLAKKYSLPIHVVYFNPDYSNLDIALMFSSVPKRCLVLMEDFDNYFHGRECAMKNDQVRFTFDSFINALDGVYNDYRGVIFVMTVNDLEKVDHALKTRPSRFRFVREFQSPDRELRARILGDNPELLDATEGHTLDQVFATQSDV